MKIIQLLSLAIVVISCSQPKDEGSSSPFMAGAASMNITPEIGMFIAGDQPNRTFTGVHDSLYVKAVVIKQNEAAVAIVSINNIGLLYPDRMCSGRWQW